MKASELLNTAIRFYKNDDFMCHVVEEVDGNQYTHGEVKRWLKDHIHSILMTRENITLMNYLKGVNPKYYELWEEYGHYSAQCHNIRIEFWRNMVNELQAAGL